MSEEDDMTDQHRLSIYLNDHLAGAIAGSELARRAASSNERSELGPFLAELAENIDQDRESLERFMKLLEIRRNLAKDAAAWLSEKVGRLKLNGQVIGYSPLSKLVELEGLSLGVNGKLSLWKTLKELSREDERIDAAEVNLLIERALSQAISLEEERTKIIGQVFSTEGPGE
ncbi:MAG: hypothetical protein LC775_01980 [Acidobacteria bacterium]|nr:hypothetical protein [Acidobacteriota bacterium]